MGMFDGINTDGVQPMEERGLVPLGEYVMAIYNSEQKPTKNYDGKYLNLEIQILEGKYKNCRVFRKLHLWNKSAQAVDIAKRELASIKLVTNTPNPANPSEFHNKPFIGKVGIEKGKDGYDDSNNIIAYKPIGSAKPTQATASAPVQQSAQPWAVPPKVGDAPAKIEEKDLF